MQKELELEHDPDYTQGFNECYAAATHLPDLADNLSMVPGDPDRAKGFQEEREQLILEKDKEKYPSWLTKYKEVDLDNDKGKEKDKEDYEPEI